MRKVRTLAPEFGIETFLATLHYIRESDVEHMREGLIKAGADEGHRRRQRRGAIGLSSSRRLVTGRDPFYNRVAAPVEAAHRTFRPSSSSN